MSERNGRKIRNSRAVAKKEVDASVREELAMRASKSSEAAKTV